MSSLKYASVCTNNRVKGNALNVLDVERLILEACGAHAVFCAVRQQLKSQKAEIASLRHYRQWLFRTLRDLDEPYDEAKHYFAMLVSTGDLEQARSFTDEVKKQQSVRFQLRKELHSVEARLATWDKQLCSVMDLLIEKQWLLDIALSKLRLALDVMHRIFTPSRGT